MLPAEYCEMLECVRQRSGAILGLFHFGSVLPDMTFTPLNITPALTDGPHVYNILNYIIPAFLLHPPLPCFFSVKANVPGSSS